MDNSTRTAAGTSPTFLLFGGVACVGIAQPSTGNNCSLADTAAATHAKYGIGLRFTCARATDLTNAAGGAPTCGDWYALTPLYAVPVDFQDSTQSDPSGDTCTIGGQASKVGALTGLLPFIMQHWGLATVRIYEGLTTDWFGAYTGGTNACWPAACFTGSCPYTVYDQMYRNAIAGLPSGTAVFGGHLQLSGNTVIQ